MQDKIFKVKIFEVTRKSVKSVKVFSLEIFRLYGIFMYIAIAIHGQMGMLQMYFVISYILYSYLL